jgi:hypothetical protein
MQLTFVFYEFVATSAHVDALMISVERMLQYIEGIEQEPSQDKGDMSDLRSVETITYYVGHNDPRPARMPLVCNDTNPWVWCDGRRIFSVLSSADS